MSFQKNITIVISSAAGGVGLSLVQFLKYFGYYNIIGIAGSDFKCRKMEKLGCKVCINYKD